MRENQPDDANNLARPAGGPDTTPSGGWPLPALEVLVYEVTALFHRLHAVAQELHGEGEFSAGKRGVLRSLDRLGPQTVPQMARARPVSRQYIQTLVNELAAGGYMELAENPAHKRSRLVRLTPQGKSLLEAMYRREAQFLCALPVAIPEEKLRSTIETLREARAFFEGEEWKRLVKAKNV